MASDFDKEFHKKFGQKVKELRLGKGLTQEDLSLKIGADNSYIGIIENAHRDIPLSKIKKIADALEISLQDLFKI